MRIWLPSIVFLLSNLAHGQERKVLIIGIDGCRGDALLVANAPNLQGLAANGISSFEGNTRPPTWSATGWSTMLTGVWEQKHKAVDNSFTNNQFATWPHFFARLKSVDPSLDLRSISHWAPINTVITTQADQELNVTTDQAVADAAVALLQTGDADVIFLQFDDVDHAGHGFGFSPNTPQYMAAIEIVDQQIGPILQAVDQRPADEEWLIIATTDHGGNGPSGHGGITAIEQRLFTIVSGGTVEPAVRTADRDTVSIASSISLAAGRHARVSSTTPYQFGAAQDFTIECRVKMPLTWSGDPVFVGNKNWNSGLNPGFALTTNTSGGTWKFNIGDGVDRVDLSGLPINDGQWHHLAVTCDRDGEARIFQDGLLLRSTSMTAIGNVNTALQLCFGQDGTTTYGSALTGNISDVRIWNAALDINTITAWSGRDLATTHPSLPDLIGHWPLNEGSGGVLVNQVAGAPTAQHYTGASATAATWSNMASYLISTDLNGTVGQADLVPTVLAHLCIANDPAWGLDGRSLIPVCAPVNVNARTYLGGAYAEGTGLMSDALRSTGLLPLTEPYTAAGFAQALSGGGEQTNATVLSTTGPNAIVDWVLLEQRSSADPTRILATKCALLQRDGDIVNTDGSTLIMPAILGDHHLAIRHRNHLGAMSAAALPFIRGGTTAMDLTTPATALFGTEAMRTVGAVRVQWPGDILRDGQVKYAGSVNDRDVILVGIGGTVPTNTVAGYASSDVSLDGVIMYTGAGNDRDPILSTIGGTIPTNVRTEQLP